jgi:hypothetical protein
MQKLAPFSLILFLAFGSCQMLKRSGPWETVENLHVQIPPGSDPSSAYAAELHRALLRDGVPHRVVSYSYVDSQRFELPAGSHTAVIYEDHTSAGSPYWLMDDQLSRPLWLPDGDLEKQLRFYIRGKSVVGITSKDYPANGFPSAPAETADTPTAQRPPTVPHRTHAPEMRTVPQPPAPAAQSARPKPVVEERPAPRKPSSPPLSASHEAAAEHKDVVQNVSKAAAHSSNEDLFREKHGTAFNPASAMDRGKMEKIKRAERR